VFGDRDGVGAGSVHHGDTVAGGGFELDVVHANTSAADHAQLPGVLEQSGIDENCRADDQGISVFELFDELFFFCDLVGSYNVPAGVLAKEIDGGGSDFFSDNNFQDARPLR
jgi:hypothetical protein